MTAGGSGSASAGAALVDAVGEAGNHPRPSPPAEEAKDGGSGSLGGNVDAAEEGEPGLLAVGDGGQAAEQEPAAHNAPAGAQHDVEPGAQPGVAAGAGL